MGLLPSTNELAASALKPVRRLHRRPVAITLACTVVAATAAVSVILADFADHDVSTGVDGVAFEPGVATLIIGNADGRVYRWRIPG